MRESEPAAAMLDAILRERYLATLANLAMRSTADAGAERPAAASTSTRAWPATTTRPNTGASGSIACWSASISPRPWPTELQTWMRDDPLHRWRLALGYLLAEQGSLEPAVKLFEGVELADELGPAAYRTLADWYLALGAARSTSRP